MRAILDHVIIRQTPPPESAGGIALVQQEAPTSGTVVAVGPGAMYQGILMPTGLEVGDRVHFGKMTGQILDLGSERFLVMRANDIIFVYDEALSNAVVADWVRETVLTHGLGGLPSVRFDVAYGDPITTIHVDTRLENFGNNASEMRAWAVNKLGTVLRGKGISRANLRLLPSIPQDQAAPTLRAVA